MEQRAKPLTPPVTPPPSTVKPSLEGVTKQELVVLKLVAQAMTNKQIAKLLFRSPKTIDNHLQSLSKKLRANNRTHLVLIYLASIWPTRPLLPEIPNGPPNHPSPPRLVVSKKPSRRLIRS